VKVPDVRVCAMSRPTHPVLPSAETVCLPSTFRMIARFLQAVGDGAVLEPPLADEGLATGSDLLARRRIDHVVVIRGDLLVQAVPVAN
jgi:hypothetical protein